MSVGCRSNCVAVEVAVHLLSARRNEQENRRYAVVRYAIPHRRVSIARKVGAIEQGNVGACVEDLHILLAGL